MFNKNFKIKINRHQFFIALISLFFLISNLFLNSRYAPKSQFREAIEGEAIINRDIETFKVIETPLQSFLFSTSEISIFGIVEIICLITTLIIIYSNRKYLIHKFNRTSYYLKLLLFSILIYEELSFITQYKFNFASSLNNQDELNLHNSHLLNIYVFDYVPIIGKVGLITILITCVLFIIGYGSYFRRLKSLNLIFLEKKNSFYSNLYFFNLAFSNLLVTLSITKYYFIPKMNINIGYVFNLELVELFIYIVLLVDTIDKVKLSRQVGNPD